VDRDIFTFSVFGLNLVHWGTDNTTTFFALFLVPSSKKHSSHLLYTVQKEMTSQFLQKF